MSAAIAPEILSAREALIAAGEATVWVAANVTKDVTVERIVLSSLRRDPQMPEHPEAFEVMLDSGMWVGLDIEV